MSAVLPFPTDAESASARRQHLVPSRFVTIELASALTGLTENAIRMKIHKGVWLEARQWVKRDGRVMIDMRGYEQWAESGRA